MVKIESLIYLLMTSRAVMAKGKCKKASDEASTSETGGTYTISTTSNPSPTSVASATQSASSSALFTSQLALSSAPSASQFMTDSAPSASQTASSSSSLASSISNEKDCINNASQLSFLIDGYFDNTFAKITIDNDSAYKAQNSNNTYGSYLLQVDDGFSFDMMVVNGKKFHSAVGATSYTGDYETKFEYDSDSLQVVDIRCNFHQERL